VKDLYPFEGNYLDLDGIKLHYLDEGRGEPIVMLHGNPTWSFYYRNMVLALKDSYRVIVPDHIGCGLSDKPDDSRYSYTLKRRIEDIESLLIHLGINRDITLVLHDWGGMIGMAYASKHTETIARIIILNTSAFHLPKEKNFPWQLWICRNEFLGGLLIRGLNAFSLGAARFCCTRKKMTDEIKKAYISPYDSWKNRIAVHRFVQDIPLKPGDPAYEIVSEVEKKMGAFADTPILICWGEKDFIFDQHFLKKWIKVFPGAEVHRFTDAGHYVLEDMGEEIISLVRKFLKSHPLKR